MIALDLGPSRPTLGPSALAGRRLAAATAGLRKASELFAHSCTIYSHNEPFARAIQPQAQHRHRILLNGTDLAKSHPTLGQMASYYSDGRVRSVCIALQGRRAPSFDDRFLEMSHSQSGEGLEQRPRKK